MSRKKVVILDAGHGGINPATGRYVTPGKRSPKWPDGTQYFEGDGNRDIVHRAAQMLVARGWKVLYTVDPCGYADMYNPRRVDISNKHYRENPDAFQISVHSNGVTDPKANGAEVWTWPGQTKSDKIADIWLEEHLKQFPLLKGRTDKTDGDNDKESRFTLNSVNCPSILVETMFQTNPGECATLMSPEGRHKIALGIVNTCERVHAELK